MGNARFHAKIERITGGRREAKPRGRPRRADELGNEDAAQQQKLEL